MATLSKDLRRQLEKIVAEARTIGEEGAEQSLHRLAVELARPHDALKEDEKKLRVTLRAHAKQLGDRLDKQPTHLKQAVAYEHWHRLLFSRFLIENDLLLHPEHGVALSLEEVKEIALEENRAWVEVAADYAQRMLLRRVFQPDDPALRVSLPPEKRQQLEAKLNSLPNEVFLADDSLGWVYQFWQRDEWERINHSETKIGADELPAVTQLFTEDYMVLFLLENTLGAWWTAKRQAEGKDPRLPGYEWTYLRMSDDGSPAAGSFDKWPRTARELRILDPCMGSGHFLVFALPILARMRMEEEGISLKDSIIAVLSDNLFGLELDARCSQIAAFNLALSAWKLAGGHFEVPKLNLACAGLGINSKESDWISLAYGDQRAEETLRKLYGLFSDAPTLGSLIDPTRLRTDLFLAAHDEIRPLLEKALESQNTTDDIRELAIQASGVAAAARILSSTFTLVCTNVPYLGREGHCETLSNFADTYASDAAADLSTLMLHRCLGFLGSGGTFALVLPQNWWVGTSYTAFRKRLLREVSFSLAVVLGEEAWWTFGNRGPNTVLLIGELQVPTTDHCFTAMDVSTKPGSAVVTLEVKSAMLRNEHLPNNFQQPKLLSVSQGALAQSKAARIAITESRVGRMLAEFVESGEGCSTGDSDRYLRGYWEVDQSPDWLSYCGPGFADWDHCDSSLVIYWQNGNGDLARSEQARMQNSHLWNRSGVLVGRVRGITATLFNGGCYSKGAVLVCPKDQSDLPAIYAFLKSPEYELYVRTIDPRVSAATSILTDVPFDRSKWRDIAAEAFPQGLPSINSHNPTQFSFDGDLRSAHYPLQVAVARLVGYRWPHQLDGASEFSDSDNIVCLAPLAGKDSAADRLRILLRTAFGSDYDVSGLLRGSKSNTLEDWLLNEFFAEHCALFNNGKEPRPFIWHVWDGRKDGFHALVNYRALDYKTLEKLIYSTLGDWISLQRQDAGSNIEGADGRLTAAEHLQNELKKILDGESPYDIFVRWKSLREQPTGWSPDLNDGIRANIRPWICAAKTYGSMKPGILRVTPNIKYLKDRGKESLRDPGQFPWFAESHDRHNDIHLSLEEKRKARGLA